ncbi:MAG: transcriptional repressor [Acetatifactor sp.]|nr:transcriptional repressor [Acetatifactor sp.]
MKQQFLHSTAPEYPQGLKWTRQRKDVYQVLLNAQEPLSASQIYNTINASKTPRSGTYAISTIYRILATFEDKNLITKTNWMGNGTVVYELNRGDHTHYAVCLSCRKRISLQGCPLTHIQIPHSMIHAQEADLLDSGFQVVGHKLELYGYCGECREQEV